MNLARNLLLAVLAAGLAACASHPVRTDGPALLRDPEALAAAQARQANREAWLRSRPGWSFSGRVAVSQAGKGGSGRLDWRQEGEGYVLSLAAPVTRQSWRLSGDAAGARLEGLEGGTREGADADELLRQATGWDVPIRHLADWARALAAPGDGPAEPAFDLDGRIVLLAQSGWRIAYSDWQPPEGDAPAMPRRLEAERGTARVRLVVDQWQFDPP